METKILDFYGDGCGNCKMLEGILKQLETEHPRVKFEKINIKDSPELVEKYQITTIPVLVFLKNGQEVAKLVGLKPKTIISKTIAQVF